MKQNQVIWTVVIVILVVLVWRDSRYRQFSTLTIRIENGDVRLR
jgi:hypothetical protein